MSTVEIAVVVGGPCDGGCGDVERGVVMGADEEEEEEKWEAGKGGGVKEGKARVMEMLLRLSIKERMEALQAKRDMREERRRKAEIEMEERGRRARSQAMDDLLKGVEVLEELSLCDIPDQEFVREMERKVKEAMRGWCARLGDVDPLDLKC